jgi:hypothetical protein
MMVAEALLLRVRAAKAAPHLPALGARMTGLASYAVVY